MGAVKFAFAVLDTKRSFYLTAADFYKFAQRAQIMCNPEEIRKGTQEYYGTIDFTSFYELLTGLQPKLACE